MPTTRYSLTFILLALALATGGCASAVNHHSSPPGSVAGRLERAGENYQATEAAPNYRQEQPNRPAETTHLEPSR